ncbi:cytoplasmic protein [Ephemerocybe angulata]|uniref:Cytoplasmic protein n=1 Tax=Ephemerocybe angulata TaxID=980116 RepID=A0A8H6M8B2_9AGAR|nr:cytoplasmic protein [Tulosesus angulatus]
MRKVFRGFKQDFLHRSKPESDTRTESSSATPPTPFATTPPARDDWIQYRKHRGVNLGSWFVLERWITDTPFRQAAQPASSDLDIAKGSNAKAILEKHWDTWVTTKEWNWLASVGINSVRIPLGYYHLCGADRSILDGTDFYPYYDVYQGAWKRITDAIIAANKKGMTVLIDLHAAPGKQNADSHSGTSNPANFFNDPHNLRRGLYAISSLTRLLSTFCASQDPPLKNIIGIELLNEPAPPDDDVLRKWYIDAVAEVRKAWVGSRAPAIYLGECWRTESYTEWSTAEYGRLAPNSTWGGLVVLDHHLYRCFTPADTQTSVQDHTRALLDETSGIQKTFQQTSESLGRAGGGIVVAEWSCGLAPTSLRTHQPQERRDFVDAQLAVYEKWCGGWWWWMLKKEESVYGKDVGWGFKDAVEGGVFPSSVGLRRRRGVDRSQRERERRSRVLETERKQAYDQHREYWSRIPGSYNHVLFESGYTDGFNDNYAFFEGVSLDSEGVSEIGFRGAWIRERARGVGELENADGSVGEHYWEYEHGFKQGAEAARTDFAKVFC